MMLSDRVSDVNGIFRLVEVCLTFCNHTLIEKFLADFDFIISTRL